MYLPAYVNFRVTDILRGYVAQPILWGPPDTVWVSWDPPCARSAMPMT